MAAESEQRKHRRMEIRLPLECGANLGDRPVTYRTVTQDISSGGVCFETDSAEFCVGTPLKMELAIPPGEGHSLQPGRVQGMGRVVRVVAPPAAGGPARFRIAAEFSEPLKLFF